VVVVGVAVSGAGRGSAVDEELRGVVHVRRGQLGQFRRVVVRFDAVFGVMRAEADFIKRLFAVTDALVQVNYCVCSWLAF
jgi:hypothetical protein